MGCVYRARDRSTGDLVALKVMLGAGDVAERDERFDREVRLLAAIDHPRVARYVSHGVAPDGRPFLAMQWLEGHDLAAELARGPLSQEQSRQVLLGAAEAVAVVHGRGIVHRDIKPSNLFLRGGSIGDLVLLDFGVSRSRDASQLLTGNAIVGTPHYMAPEQASSARDIPPAADVFSIGCVFYECLTGKRPFAAPHLFGVLARILYEEPEPVHASHPDVPASWSVLLASLLDKRPGARPADGAALLRAIASLPEGGSSSVVEMRTPDGAATTAASRSDASDQVLVCVVLATPLEAPASPGQPPDSGAERLDAIRSALHRFGCPLERLPDGSLLATVLPRSSATELVHVAARWALYLREQMPDARVAVATGRAPHGPGHRIGEAVDRAAHLLERAMSGGPIALDRVTAELLDGRFTTAAEGTPEGVHFLVGARPDFDASRPLLGKPTPCVGRELELIQLEGVMASAADDRMPKAALVVAPPGTGKSRLRHELLRRLRQRHPSAAVLVGYGDPLSAGSPYVLLADALRRQAGIRGGEAPAEARALIVDNLCRPVEAAQRRRVSEFIGELAGVHFPDETSPPLAAARGDHRVMSEQIAMAFVDWLAAACAAGPVILVLEDLQWGDALTVKLLEHALRDLERGALFILALGRPEVHEIFPKLLGDRLTVSLSLRALGAKASEELVRGVLQEKLAQAAVDRIVRLAAGNALFLEELIRAAAEGKAGEVPETVVAMLQARLSRLEPAARLLLRAASVLGETFWRGGVRAVARAWGAGDDPDPWLALLVDDELVARRRDSRFPGDAEYTFRHALVCEAAGGLLTDDDRRSGHLAAGQWLVAMGEVDGIVLARHAEEGGDLTGAIAFTARAAEQSIGKYDFAEALARANKGIALGAEGAVLGRLRSVAASAWYNKGQWNEAAEAGLAALELVPHGGVSWCAVIEMLMQVLPNVGQLGRSEALSEELLRVVPAPEARGAYLRALNLQLFAYALTGQHRRGQACLEFIDGLEIPQTDIVARGYSLLYRGVFTFLLGRDLAASLASVQQAARDLAEGQVIYRLSHAQIVASFVWWGLGDYARAERAARDAQATARGIRDDYHAALAAWYIGLSLVEQGVDDPSKLDEADRCAEAMLLLERSPTFLAASRVITARIALGRGDLKRAEQECLAARPDLLPIPAFWLMAESSLLDAVVAQGRASEAAALARQGLAFLDGASGPFCSEVVFRVAAARALHASGDSEAAARALEGALREMGLRAALISDAELRRSYLGREENRRAGALARTWGVRSPTIAG
jgi:serine/threonine protein kinase